MKQWTSIRLTRVALCAALTAVAAQVSVPLTEVPFTLQVFAVIVCGLVLGAADGFWSQVVYLALGAVGAPVFAGFSGGYGALLGPTAGYLWAFPAAAWAAGRLAAPVPGRPLGLVRAAAAALAAVVIIYAGGMWGLQVYFDWSAAEALARGVLPFVAFDLIKAALAAVVAVRVRAALGARGRAGAA